MTNGQISSGIYGISIHAPARGATKEASDAVLHDYISIHAPARGATLWLESLQDGVKNFNPRSREGSDDVTGTEHIILSDFNPRSREGSDFSNPTFFTGLVYFNPRSREGSDSLGSRALTSSPTFQSTLPRGERHFWFQ